MNINLTAPFNQLGYGIASLNIFKALEAAGHRICYWPIGPVKVPAEDVPSVQEAMKRTKFLDWVCPSLRIWHPNDMAQHAGRGRRVGLTFFELDSLTDVQQYHLAAQDLVIVPTVWAKQVLEEAEIYNVAVTPLGVDGSLFGPRPMPQHEETVYFACGKWEYRKGHDLLCEAFSKAFVPSDNVRLVLNCSNPFLSDEQTQEWHNRYRWSAMGHKVSIVPQRLETQRHLADVMASVDCGVFPARAEGWNLELAEMMAMGRPVIATNYGGHTQFCNPLNCRLIDVDALEDAFDGIWFHGEGRWAKFGAPQMEQLVEHLREVHRLKQCGQLEHNEAGVETFRRLTWANTAAAIVEAFQSRLS